MCIHISCFLKLLHRGTVVAAARFWAAPEAWYQTCAQEGVPGQWFTHCAPPNPEASGGTSGVPQTMEYLGINQSRFKLLK